MSENSVKAVIEVGVAVKDLEQATKALVDAFGAIPGEIKHVEEFKMRYRMCNIGGMDFELMESTGEGGIIDSYLKARPEGLHHIALKVSNIEKVLQTLKDQGVKLIDESPKGLGGEHGKFAFVHPKSFNGVMFELIDTD